MYTQLVEIQPRELKFIFEVKRQCSCAVHLANVTDQYVAFKVKTTSPKKYCVRPNVGIIKPKSTYDFTVTMQAQKSAPAEMVCKDKFLVQSAMVPFGTTEEDITPSMFVKDGEKYIEETKLRVVLTSPPNSPVKVALKQEASHETPSPKEHHSPDLLHVNGFLKQEPPYDAQVPEEKLQSRVEHHTPDLLTMNLEAVENVENVEKPRSSKVMDNMNSFPTKAVENVENMEELRSSKVVNNMNSFPTKAVEHVKNMEESRSPKVVDDMKSFPAKLVELFHHKDEEANGVEDDEEAKLMLAKEIEELKSKFSAMNSKLVEAEQTIMKLNEEKTNTIHEKEKIKQELVILRRKGGLRKVRIGFPPLFVCMVALIGLMVGFSFRA